MMNMKSIALPEGYRRIIGTFTSSVLNKILDEDEEDFIQVNLIRMKREKEGVYLYTLKVKDYELDVHVEFNAPFFNSMPATYESMWVRMGSEKDEIVVIIRDDNYLGAIEHKEVDDMGRIKSTFSLSNGKEVKMYIKRNLDAYQRYHDEYESNKAKMIAESSRDGFINGTPLNALGMNLDLIKSQKYDDEESKAYALESYKSNCIIITDNDETQRYLDGKGYMTEKLEPEEPEKCSCCGKAALHKSVDTYFCNACRSRIGVMDNKTRRMVQRMTELCGI